MIKIDNQLKPADLETGLERMWGLSGQKVRLIEEAIAERDGPGDPAADKGGFQAEQIMLIEEETR